MGGVRVQIDRSGGYSVVSDASGYKSKETKRLKSMKRKAPNFNHLLFICFIIILIERWCLGMKQKVTTYDVRVNFQTREETERRHTVSRKLAQIINLSASSTAVR